MKPTKFFMSTCLAVTLLACSPQAPAESEMDSAQTGSDRDSHGCIGSAGYQWSEVASECIRLFERGIALTHMQDLKATSVPYLVPSPDETRMELFVPDGTSAVLDEIAEDQWEDITGNYLVKFERPAMYVVYDNAGKTLYFEDRSNENSDLPEGRNDDWLSEIGVFSRIEEGGYPFYSLNVEFPKREMVMAFLLDVEELGISPDAIERLEGKSVSFEYTSDLEKNVVEIELESGFVLGWVDREDLRDYKTERGILGGAEVTMGDRAGSFYLEDAEGGRVVFETFVTPELAAANGRDAIVYYNVATENRIKGLSLDQD
jgi:hypothetical protein